MPDRDRDPLEWLRRIVVKGHPDGTVGGEILRHGIIVKVAPALLDVAEAARPHTFGPDRVLSQRMKALLATIREQMERSDG